MMAGRKVVTLRQRFLAVGRLVGLEAPGLHELRQAAARGRVVLDDEHPFPGVLGRGRSLFVHRHCFIHVYNEECTTLE